MTGTYRWWTVYAWSRDGEVGVKLGPLTVAAWRSDVRHGRGYWQHGAYLFNRVVLWDTWLTAKEQP